MRQAMLALGCFLAGIVLAQVVKFPSPQGQTVKAIVTKVVDGDTIEVQIPSEKTPFTVRIIGYDAPELGYPFGENAKEFLRALLEGREVLLESDAQQKDRYGRRLYHVWLQNVHVGELVLLSGLGLHHSQPPNVKYSDFLQRTEKLARSIGLGLWAGLPKEVTKPSPVFPTPAVAYYIGNRRSMIFHRPECEWAQRMSPANRVILKSRDEAIRQGFRPCKVCQP